MAKKMSGKTKDVTVIVDSGCFLKKEGRHCEIGYFQCKPSEADITVTVDGRPVKDRNLLNLGEGNCLVEIQHRSASGKTKKGGIRIPKPFHKELLHLKDLYGRPLSVKRKNFDTILRFDSGEFGVTDVRERKFKKFKKLTNGKLSTRPDATKPLKPIAHDIVVRFALAEGESIALTRNGEQFWSSKGLEIKSELQITINADDSTTEKFYRTALTTERDSYWLPNPFDPPPSCPLPPCQDSLGTE